MQAPSQTSEGVRKSKRLCQGIEGAKGVGPGEGVSPVCRERGLCPLTRIFFNI